ncbi:P-loop containing nucleoside triphosphate hydrolase protein [Blastocladiella britannica]|nr:P-loop containing nucleoside triphosphate hydrolase protein [Blastocladiella britannica]
MATSSLDPSLVKLRLASEARNQDEQRDEQRKTAALVLIHQYLLSNRYLDTLQHFERETGVSHARFSIADNVDLITVLAEFEQYYQLKFDRTPKLFHRLRSGGASSLNGRGETAAAAATIKRAVVRRHESTASISPVHSAARPSAPARPMQPDSSETAKQGGGSKPRKLVPLSMAEAYKHLESPLDASPTDPNAFKKKQDSALDLSMSGTGMLGGGQPPPKSLECGQPFVGESMAMPHGATPDEVSLPFQRLLKAVPYAVSSEFRDLASIITRDIFSENPNVRFADIAGLHDAKSLAREAVVFPMRYPELFHPPALISPWRGILLYGPPGTGKTLLAKAVATECNTTFFHVSASSLVSKWRGDSEKLVRVLFELAKHHAPSTIFVDEIESIMSHRGSEGGSSEHEGSRRMKTELLVQLDGMVQAAGGDNKEKPVFFLAATNMPWELDYALLRRLEKRILVNLPDPAAREQILRAALPQNISDAFGNVLVDPDLDYTALAGATDGWSGSDLKTLAKESLMVPLRQVFAALDLGDVAAPSSSLARGKVTGHVVQTAMKSTRGIGAVQAWESKYVEWGSQYGSG